jgi:GAF domain-containing protein
MISQSRDIAGFVPISITNEQRHALVLKAWAATNMERDLHGVLAGVAEVLVPLVPVDSMAVVVFGREPPPAKPRLYAMHIVGQTGCDRESSDEVLRRAEVPPRRPPDRPIIAYDDLIRGQVGSGQPYTCPNLLEKETWYPHEYKLFDAGIRAYASVPLQVRGKLIGVAPFCRTQPIAFPPQELIILSDISRAIAVAVANALANEEIGKLRDQLEAENISLREQLGQSPWFEEVVGESGALWRVLESVEQVAGTDATVLITGETGT